jgi:hypothetical protein
MEAKEVDMRQGKAWVACLVLTALFQAGCGAMLSDFVGKTGGQPAGDLVMQAVQ